MNKTFSQQQISRTGNLDSNLMSRQYKLNLMADFVRIKNEIPKLKQSEIANLLSYSSSTSQRYRVDINKLSPYRIQSNKRTKKASNTNFNNNSHREADVKRPQMTLKQLKQIQNQIKKNKIILKVGSMHENVEIKNQFLDEILDTKDL